MSRSVDEDEPEGTFSIFFAEGETLAKQDQYPKALESFTKALDFQPEDKSCLVARSKCYLQLGNTEEALKDVEYAMKEDKKYHKGLYQKAEVLYSMGEFEHALMFYHRGRKIRPELEEFTLGIQKAQEAINNSIGSTYVSGCVACGEKSLACKTIIEEGHTLNPPTDYKLDKIGDLSYFQQQDTVGKKKKKLLKPQVSLQQKKERKLVVSDKTVKELLGELYSDREYLEKLVGDPSLVIGQKDRSIYNAAEEALFFLDSRTEFWRQQKPMYARKREKELRKFRPSPTKPRPLGIRLGGGVNHTKFVLKSLEDVDSALANGDAEKSLKQAQKLMKTVEGLTAKDLPNQQEFVASLHSCIGNAQLELGDAEVAMEHHLKDLAIAEKLEIKEIKSRALDNVGRVHAVMGNFQKAAECWTKKLPLINSQEESAWLHHELGRCQLELGNHAQALEMGEKSLNAAREASDQMWQLNASMLIAQAESNLGDVQGSLQSFERALELAKILDDDGTQTAIKKAMEDINEKIVKNLLTSEQEKSEEGAEDEKREEEKQGEEEVKEEGEEEGAEKEDNSEEKETDNV